MEDSILQSAPVPHTSDAGERFWQQLLKSSRHSRRSFPRVHAIVPVCVLGVEKDLIDLCTKDMSFGGLQVRCDPQTIKRLLQLVTDADGPQGQRKAKPKNRNTYIKLVLCLTLKGEERKIQCLARIVHVVQIPKAPPGQEIAVGFQFLGFKGKGKQIVGKFIEDFLIPADL